MNDGRNAKAGEKAGKHIAGHFIQQRAQLAAGTAFQSLSHQIHAEQKQAQSADHGQYLKNIHSMLSFIAFTFILCPV